MGAELRVLGKTELMVDDRPVALGGNRQRAIVAYLALHAGRSIPITEVVSEVWGSAAPTTVVKSLSTLVSRLRNLLDPSGHLLRHDGVGYRLDVPAGGLDVATFRDGVRASRVAELRGDASGAEAHLRAALAAWNGPALDGLSAPFAAPMAALLEDERAAAEHALARLLDPRAGLPAEAPATRTIGREAELARLEATAQLAAAGGRRVLLITGEAGVGKSHLVRALGERLGARGLPVLIGRCDPLRANPLGPLLQAIGHAEELGLLPSVPFSDYPAVAAALGGGPWSAGPGAADGMDAGELHRRRILAEVAELAQLIGRDHPLIVAVEDLQWADPFTVMILEHLAGLDATATTCLIATARSPEFEDSEAAGLLARVASLMPVDVLELAPLPADAVRELVGDVLPLADQVPEVFDEIERGSGGNPLFALHFARHIADHGRDVALGAPLPASSLELFEARIQTLDSPTRDVVSVAATLGLEFAKHDLARVARVDPVKLDVLLEQCRRAGLLEVVEPSAQLRFVHGLVRRAAYEALDQARRAELHRTAAEHLGHGAGEANIAIAEHLWRARWVVPHDEVAAAIAAACGTSIGFGAVGSAEELLRKGLELDVPPGRQAELHVRLGEVLVGEAKGEEGGRHLGAGRRLARDVDRWDLVADAILGRRRLGISPSVEDAERRARHATEALAVPGLDTDRRARLLLYRADLKMNIDLDASERDLDAAEALFGHQGPSTDRRVRVLRLRGREARGEDPDGVARTAQEHLDDALAVEDLFTAAHFANILQRSRIRGGRFRACLDDADRFDELATTIRRPDLVYELRAGRVAARSASQPLGVVDEESHVLSEAGLADGVASAATVRFLQLWVIRREQLRLHELAPMLLAIAQTTRRPGAPVWQAPYHLELGDPAAASVVVDGLAATIVARPPDWAQIALLCLVADVRSDLGAAPEADLLYGRLMPAAGQVAVIAGLTQVLGRVDRYLGRLARLRGDLDTAVQHFETARRLDTESGAGLWVAWAAHDEALTRRQRGGPGDDAAASGLVNAAAATAKRYGSRRLAAAIRSMRVPAP